MAKIYNFEEIKKARDREDYLQFRHETIQTTIADIQATAREGDGISFQRNGSTGDMVKFHWSPEKIAAGMEELLKSAGKTGGFWQITAPR